MRLSTEDIIRLAPVEANDTPPALLTNIVEATRGNAATLEDIKKLCSPFLSTPDISGDAAAFLNVEYAASVLKAFAEAVTVESALDEEAFKRAIGKVKKSTGEKGKRLFMPIRCALTGQTEGIELVKVLTILGKEEALKRLAGAIKA